MDTAHEEGREEGRLEERFMIAKKLREQGFNIEQIAQITNLTLQQLTDLM